MRDFACPHCGQRLVFDSSVGLSCSHGVGFDLDVMELAEVDLDGCTLAEPARRICVNLETAGGNGVVTVAYRILLGHRRQEVDHYCLGVLARSGADRAELEALFAGPGSDDQAALDRHYWPGARAGGESDDGSSDATMHPAEDWAETSGHYLHMRDTVDTAAAFGFAPAGATATSPMAGAGGFSRLVDLWFPLAWSLTMLNRSMGHHDLHSFVLPPRGLTKMSVAHRLVTPVRAEPHPALAEAAASAAARP